MLIERFSNLEFTGWNDLKEAITQLIREGVYQNFVDIHAAMEPMDPDGFQPSRHRMHGSMAGPLGYRRFLPWHRAYLIAFERELRRINPDLSIPYWDWDADAGRLVGFPHETDELFREVGWEWERQLGTTPSDRPRPRREPWFTREGEIQSLQNFEGSYYVFTRYLENNPHNRGHGWIGGDMANPMISPRDPAFWFHHAQVDRIWALWQQNNPGEHAYLSDEEARLDPWDEEFDVRSINDISDLGDDSYRYVGPREIVS